jgi:hypothetical protein
MHYDNVRLLYSHVVDDGLYFASAGTDNSVKVFDVVNFDLVAMHDLGVVGKWWYLVVRIESTE